VINDSKPRKLWFDCGFWWYACPHKKAAINISGIIREELFQIDSIAKRLGLTRKTFERVVKESFGIPPGTWLRQQRAVVAGFRIREGASIKEIALELGFSHQGEFTIEFKRWHRINPNEYQAIAKARRMGLPK
jgi:AraC-like DNA-binding protein